MSSEESERVQIVIPLSIPKLGKLESRNLAQCIDTNWVSSGGPFVEQFENAIADHLGRPHAIATSSGTAALHAALLALGVKPQEEVLVSTLTFIAPANAIRYVGAIPVFMDADPSYWQMDPAKVGAFLEECLRDHAGLINRQTGRRIAAILPVHILGHPCDMDALGALSKQYDLPLIEDASQSLGARFDGAPVGSHGDIACLSFNGNKIVTTGGGGMVVTGHEEIAGRVRYLTTQARDDPIEYVHREIGYNYRMSNVHAALGCAQLEQLEGFVDKKRAIADSYAKHLADLPGTTFMSEASKARSSRWLSTLLVDPSKARKGSRPLIAALAAQGIQSRPLWQPLHRSDAHRGSPSFQIECADRLFEEALSLPSSVTLSAGEQERVIEAVRGELEG